jgi:hypothetical protein
VLVLALSSLFTLALRKQLLGLKDISDSGTEKLALVLTKERHFTNALRNALDSFRLGCVLDQLLLKRVLNTNNTLNGFTKIVAELVELVNLRAVELRDEVEFVASFKVTFTITTLPALAISRNGGNGRQRRPLQVEITDALGRT